MDNVTTETDWKPAAECELCGKPASNGMSGVGWYCSDDCRLVLVQRFNAYEAELLTEPIGRMPEQFENAGQINKFTHKLALHVLRAWEKMDPKTRPSLMPIARIPSEMGSYFTGLLVDELRDYLEVERFTGHARLFSDGSFRVVKPIPAPVMADAVVRAGICTRREAFQ